MRHKLNLERLAHSYRANLVPRNVYYLSKY